jgi:alpha-tubulin suppressor-like RCC1 family protein
MAGQFISPEGDLETIFVSDYAIIDQFAKTGSLWLVGRNIYGQLGNNSSGNRYSSPIQTVSGGTNWKQIKVTDNGSAAIKTDGTLWLWGKNGAGGLGDNSITNKSSPVQTISGGTNWLLVSIAGYFSAAIKTDGTLWLWGLNTYGNLGNNTRTNVSSPIQTISGGNNWKEVAIGGSTHSAAIKTDGTLWLWGRNQYGQLGNNSTTNVSSPIQTISGGTNWKQVSAGDRNFAAIKTDGTLWIWGDNSFGQLGNNTGGTGTNKSSPIQTVSGGTNWKQVSVGGAASVVGAIKTDGTLWLWGANDTGQLGNNSVSPTKISSPIQTVSGGTNWKQVFCSNNNAASIKTDGTLWAWGYNSLQGQLGDNTRTSRSSPVQTVAGGTNWKQCSITGNGALGAIYFYDAFNLYPSA